MKDKSTHPADPIDDVLGFSRALSEEQIRQNFASVALVYPAAKDVLDEEIYTEAHVEHDGAKVLIAEILAGDPEDEFYDANVKVLSEQIKHHVKEEERALV